MKIAILGAGNMGGAIAAGLAASNYKVTVSNPTPAKLEALRAAHPAIETTASNREAAAGAAIVFVATRPAMCLSVIDEIADTLAEGALVVTLAPQHPLSAIRVPAGRHAARMMPNTAIAICRSMTFVTFGDDVPEATRAVLLDALHALGEVDVIPESLFGPATALCSCGLAYALRYVRAASEGAVATGFRADEAVRCIAATLHGAAALLEATGEHPEALIDRVTTPGGTTIRGLLAMEKAGFTNAVVQGILASSHE